MTRRSTSDVLAGADTQVSEDGTVRGVVSSDGGPATSSSPGDWPDRRDFHAYVESIAHARFVIRRVMRIADEEARKRGLEPLQHQVLLQVYGTEKPLSIRGIADRMDVVPAFASRLVKHLEDAGYISRRSSKSDKRVSYVEATPEGIALLRDIDADVQVHVQYFQRQLSPEARLAALATFGFYVGLSGTSPVAVAIESSRAAVADVSLR